MRILSALGILSFLLSLLNPVPSRADDAPSPKNPYLAGLLGEIFPGAGYLYNGNLSAGLLSGALIFPTAMPYYANSYSFYQNNTYSTLAFLASEVNGYTVYDAFQDALAAAGKPAQVVDIPHYSFKELYLSPFSAESYQNWRVWPALAVPMGAFVYEMIAGHGVRPIPAMNMVFVIPAIFAGCFLIGVGEEAEFRGYQFPAWSQLTGSPWAGAAISSVTFGLAHVDLGLGGAAPYGLRTLFRVTSPNFAPFGTQNLTLYDLGHALYTTGFGMYASWLTVTSGGGFKSAILVHGIGDAVLYLAEFLTTGSVGALGFQLSLPMPI